MADAAETRKGGMKAGEQLADWRRMAASEVKGQDVADLAWTRLTIWREIIAQAWSDGSLREVTAEDYYVRVSHPGTLRTAGACYLTAWLEKSLASRPVEIAFAESGSVAGVCSVRFESANSHVDITVNGGAIELWSKAASARLPEPPETEYDLMREELGTDQVALGTLLASYWRLPPQITACIRYHQNPMETDSFHETVALVHVARGLVRAGMK